MDIFHRIGINSKKDNEFLSVIEKIGVKFEKLELPGGVSSLIDITFSEFNEHWKVVSELIASYGASDMVETYFSKEEILKAEWLRLVSTFEQGYPQPKPKLAHQATAASYEHPLFRMLIDKPKLTNAVGNRTEPGKEKSFMF